MQMGGRVSHGNGGWEDETTEDDKKRRSCVLPRGHVCAGGVRTPVLYLHCLSTNSPSTELTPVQNELLYCTVLDHSFPCDFCPRGSVSGRKWLMEHEANNKHFQL